MPLMKQWKYHLQTCYNSQQSGISYVSSDGIHYRLPIHILGDWDQLIKAGQADMETMPPHLLQDLRPARPVRGKNKAPAQPMPQPFGYPYIMPPPAPMYTSPYGWPPPYTGGAAPLPPYPPPYPSYPPPPVHPQQQQAFFLTSAVPPASSSPPTIPDGDPDELVEEYLDWLIKRYPRQEGELRKVARIVLEEAFGLPDLRRWAKNLEENTRLAGTPQKLKERIDKDFKPYLHMLEKGRQRGKALIAIDLSQDGQTQADEHDEQNLLDSDEEEGSASRLLTL